MDYLRETIVSLIIPTRNRSAQLKECILSIRKQEGISSNVEIIVVDDGSRDETPRMIENLSVGVSDTPIRYIRLEGRGANACRNVGIQEAQGQIIALIDDDTILPRRWLHVMLQGLVSSGAEVVTGPVRLTAQQIPFRKHGQEISSLLAEVSAPPRGLRGEVLPVLGNMVAWHKVFQRALFDETVRPPVEEIDWVYRVGVRTVFVPEGWVWHNKDLKGLTLRTLLRMAWRRGSETGWWLRTRAGLSSYEKRMHIRRSLGTAVRALGHALTKLCWAGMITTTSELARTLALLGLINRGKRTPKSWR